ncbi:triose-phosphate isomerase [Duganella sp. CY15W]|uniref:triose-phosphate isomerase n=1 Tax=Duganella sp. CY15W TaxID=2692172 RepID=UPI0013695EF6|nr:triose-phosphate isomerase [Duganella sp. CY15W]MYM31669.1 triose-phosphate isomerase [Duganella sp. CY15W]
MTNKLIIGNWKMNGNRASIKALLAEIVAAEVAPGCEVVVCAPSPYLAMCAHILSGSTIRLGAQDLSAHEAGAYTGEVSASMLREFGCHYVLIGHSEWRTYHHENDAVVARKTLRALEAGLIPVVCVGETLHERERGQTEAVLSQQVLALTTALSSSQLAQIVMAYEPVWAIGTGRSASAETAQQAHATIRRQLNAPCSILYGGSVKPDNAAPLLVMPDIDGVLIGGASLNAKAFLAIANR